MAATSVSERVVCGPTRIHDATTPLKRPWTPSAATMRHELASTHTALLAIMTIFMYFPWEGSGGELWDIGRGGVGGRSEE